MENRIIFKNPRKCFLGQEVVPQPRKIVPAKKKIVPQP
jgi:hypothetical protein